MSTTVQSQARPLKKPYYQYASYLIIVARMLHDRADRNIEFNPDFINPDLVRQLEEVDTLLINHNGLTDVAVIAAIVQRWEEFQYQHGSGMYSYHKSNASLV